MARQSTDVRQRLEARLRSLQHRLAEIEETLREPEDIDIEEQIGELTGDDVLEIIAVAGRAESARIRAALKRMDDGTYGRCLSCGKAISKVRLRALPEATDCRPCARRGAASVA